MEGEGEEGIAIVEGEGTGAGYATEVDVGRLHLEEVHYV